VGKVRAGLEKLERGDVRKFYEDLNNSLITVSGSFKEEIEKIIDRSSRAIAETKPEVEKEGEGLPL
jgi:archaellum component FlaC